MIRFIPRVTLAERGHFSRFMQKVVVDKGDVFLACWGVPEKESGPSL